MTLQNDKKFTHNRIKPTTTTQLTQHNTKQHNNTQTELRMDRKKQLFGQLIGVLLSLFLVYHYTANYGENFNAERKLLAHPIKHSNDNERKRQQEKEREMKAAGMDWKIRLDTWIAQFQPNKIAILIDFEDDTVNVEFDSGDSGLAIVTREESTLILRILRGDTRRFQALPKKNRLDRSGKAVTGVIYTFTKI